MKAILKKTRRWILIFVIVIAAVFSIVYGMCWAMSYTKYSVDFGISFSPEYAEYLGLDWETTYNAILNGLKPKFIRIAATWNTIEPQKGQYSYANTDYMMSEAGKNNVKVLFAVGQKVPRWPECYFPDWFKKTDPIDEREKAILSYIENVVNRYKGNPALEYWQVENEAFIKFTFGECAGFDKEMVQKEIDLVRKLDPYHKIVVTDSGEMSVWYSASKAGDIFGSTLYRTVISKYGYNWSYWYLPAGFYKIKARIFGDNFSNFMISELQAEPWFGDGQSPSNTSVIEQEKLMSVEQMQENIDYSQYVGASRVYLWGAEWWYWLKEIKGESAYWDKAREVFSGK